MDQHWQIVAPRTSEYLGRQSTLESMLFKSDDLLKHLIIPETPQAMHHSWKHTNRYPPLANAGINSLPTELIHLIFTYLEIDDMVCFGATHSRYWRIGREHIYKIYSSGIGQLAGKPLVCVGDKVDKGDYPEGLFTTEEVEKLGTLTLSAHDNSQMVPFRLCDISHPDVGTLVWSPDLEADTRVLFRLCRKRGVFPNDPAFDKLISQIIANNTWFYAVDQEWVLRNLTTKELVLVDRLTDPSKICGPLSAGIGFREAIICRTCWSSRACPDIKKNISRGVWAGHRFDIITVSRHVREVGDAASEWRDVSDDVLRDIEEIMEGEYGLNWRVVHE
ncbi:hypothetical protein PT974_09408 [Cladobotryum mycophilum]|uniref:F-box domain-containing protein n=1 Tax=Cladobotryum mycophilum TaxID=491253 RepID=A0ABR0SHB6_9HYPO